MSSASPVKLVRFSSADLSQAREGRPSQPISGDTRYRTVDAFASPDGIVDCGVWEASAGAFRSNLRGKVEFCHIVEGSCRVVDPDGTVHHLKAGDSLVLPEGFQGHWEVDERVRKVYSITQVPASA